MKQKFNNAYQSASNTGKKHLNRRPYILPLFGLLIGVAIVLAVVLTRNGQSLRVSDYHVVFLFDKGQKTTLDSKATTVGELLKEDNIQLSDQDVVEPALDTKIAEDNYRVNIYRARPVTIVDGQKKTITLTAQRSARVVAQKAGLKVYSEDDVVFAQGSLANNTIGEEVLVRRAKAITLDLYGKNLKMHTHSKTVGELLADRGVIMAKSDSLTPSADTKIKNGLHVFVFRKGIKIVTKEEIVSPPVQYVNDNSLSLGATVVRQQGSAGLRSVTYQVTTRNGKVFKRKVIQSVTIEKAVPQIVARGNVVNVGGSKEKIMAAAGIKASDYGYVNFIISHESNWNPAARNAGGCLGLGQACPGSKLPCSLSDPVCQLKFFSGYANGRYGGWGGAYNFWVSHNWW